MGFSIIAYPQIIFKSSEAPDAEQGRIWIDTDDGKMYYYDGSSWIDLTPSSGGIEIVYTGDGFDSLINGATMGDEDSHELDAIVDVGAANYVKITVLGTSHQKGSSSANKWGLTQLKAQIKEVGGAYADILAYMTTMRTLNDQIGDKFELTESGTYVMYYALTAGMKTNGIQLKMWSNSTSNENYYQSDFTNIQTIVELI